VTLGIAQAFDERPDWEPCVWDFAPHRASSPTWQARRLLASGIPAIDVSSEAATWGLRCLTVDDRAIGRLAAQSLLADGHPHCAFVGWGLGTLCRRTRRRTRGPTRANSPSSASTTTRCCAASPDRGSSSIDTRAAVVGEYVLDQIVNATDRTLLDYSALTPLVLRNELC